MPKYLLTVCWDGMEQGTEPKEPWAPVKPRGCQPHTGVVNTSKVSHMPCGHSGDPAQRRETQLGSFLVSSEICPVGSQGLVWGGGCRRKKLN